MRRERGGDKIRSRILPSLSNKQQQQQPQGEELPRGEYIKKNWEEDVEF